MYRFRRGRPTWGSMARAAGLFGSRKRKSSSGYPKSKKFKSSRRRKFSKSTARRKTSYVRNSKRGKAPMSLLKQLAAPNIIKSSGATRVESGSNAQGIYFQTFMKGQSSEPTSLTAVFDAAGVYGDNPTKEIFIEYVSMKFQMTSQTTAQTKVTIYDLVSRRDLAYGDASNNPNNLYVDSCSQVGISNAYAPGVTPYNAPGFCSRWKVKKQKTFVLNPGQVHRHNVFRYHNWRVPRYTYDKNNYDVDTLAKRTQLVMIIIQGFPCNDRDAQSLVGIAPTALDVTFQSEVKYRMIQDNSTTYQVITNLVNPLSSMTTPTVMDDDSGQGTAVVRV